MQINYYFKVIFSTLPLLFGVITGQSQNNYWQEKKFNTINLQRKLNDYPINSKIFLLKHKEFTAQLTRAQSEQQTLLKDSEVIIELPMPHGYFEKFQIIKYDMMDFDLSSRYPNIRTYYGISTKNQAKKIRFSWTKNGFLARISERNNNIMIVPIQQDNNQYYVSYYEKSNLTLNSPFICHFQDKELDSEALESQEVDGIGDCKFRTYRLAIATTGKYANERGAKSETDEEKLLSAVVNTVNLANAVLENDLSVRLILIDQTTDLFYYNEATDPFNPNTGTWISQNKANTNQVIGSSNFDIGHLFRKGDSGVAALKSVCKTGKAAATSGRKNKIDRHLRIFLHELGHQFGAKHTQINDCNRSNDSSFEPGSGSTIMGYAGVCSPNIQGSSDLYYHVHSLKQIHNSISKGSAKYCATYIDNPNSTPFVNAGEDYTIPINTPFILTPKDYADPDSTDNLTFVWEQFNKKVAPMPPLSTSTEGPCFRSFPPSANSISYFPKINKVINNTLCSGWQCLPSVARNMKFKVTIRDNSVNMGGCVAEDIMEIMITDSAGPFKLTYPSDSEIQWQTHSFEKIEWDVARTDLSPVLCTNVDLSLSIDGGKTYPISIAKNIPNIGYAIIEVPDTLGSSMRIRIQGSNNIFYDISNQNFEIIAGDFVNTTEKQAYLFSISPNPTKDFVNITFFNKHNNGSIHIFNTLGQSISSFPLYKHEKHKRLPIKHLSTGMYMIQIKIGSKVLLEKLIIE